MYSHLLVLLVLSTLAFSEADHSCTPLSLPWAKYEATYDTAGKVRYCPFHMSPKSQLNFAFRYRYAAMRMFDLLGHQPALCGSKHHKIRFQGLHRPQAKSAAFR